MKVPNSIKDIVEGVESLVYVEDLSGKKGVMQSINPLAKLFAIIGMIVASLFIANLTAMLAICLIPIFFALTSRIPLKDFFLRTAMVTAFTAFISIPQLFFGSTPVWTGSLGGVTLAITSEGLHTASIFTVRVWFCVASLIMFVLSTGFDKTLKILATLRVPSLIIQLSSLTYRYFFVSIYEAHSVLLAKEARTYLSRRAINMQSLRDLGNILAALFIRTFERSERVHLAMKARGFEIDSSNKLSVPRLRLVDVLFASSIIVTFALFAIL